MATKVYETVDVELLDGQILTLRPASLKVMRKFTTIMNDFAKTEEQSENLEVVIQACAVLLKPYNTDWTDEEIEELVDMETLYKVIEVCGGIKLNDPKMIEMAQQALAAQAGKNLSSQN